MASGGQPSRGDAIVAAFAAAYLAWSFVPRWYTSGGETVLGIPLPQFTLNAWEGSTRVASIVAVIALAWIGLRVGRARAGARRVDLVLAVTAAVLTLAGFVVGGSDAPGEAEPSWGLAVAIAIALAWSYAAWRTYRGAGIVTREPSWEASP